MNQIICPHCGKEVELSQALRAEIEKGISLQLKEDQKVELAKLKKTTLEEAEKKFKEETALKEKNLLSQIEQLQKDKKSTEEKELALLKKEQEIVDKSRKLEIDLQRKLNEEVDRVRKEEEQKAKLEKLELEKKLTDTQKSLEEAQRKTKQGSQQLQGEVLELDLENQLKSNFVHDEILPVAKGTVGADVWQKVRNSRGQEAGSILWELKRTKAWSNSWLAKLRDDTRALGASSSVLISETLPENLKHFGLLEGIWVTSYTYAIPLAVVLRTSLLQVAVAKSAAANKDEKLEDLYQYLTSETFRHRFEAQVEAAIEQQGDLETEKRSTLRSWKKREQQIKKLIGNTASMYGELQGIVGNSLPTIKSLEAPTELEEENEQEDLFT